MKQIQLKYPKKVFPSKVTKMCSHDWPLLVEKKAKYLSLREISTMQRLADLNRNRRTREGTYSEVLAVRNNKGIKIIDLFEK